MPFINHTHAPFPYTNALVIGRCHESTVLVHERYRVNSSQVSVVFLHDLAVGRVELEYTRGKMIRVEREEVVRKERRMKQLTVYIFLSEHPTTKRCCLSSSGLNFMQ